MALKIYGVLRSRATRALWMAKELGLAFEHVPVIQAGRVPNPAAPDAPLNTTSAAFLAINPNGLIPTIDDDGFVLNESMAITLYLARKHGGPLAPKDAKEDALMTMWTLWAATECEGPALRAMQNGSAVKVRDIAAYEAAVSALQPKLAVLDAALREGQGSLSAIVSPSPTSTLRRSSATPRPHPSCSLPIQMSKAGSRPANRGRLSKP